MCTRGQCKYYYSLEWLQDLKMRFQTSDKSSRNGGERERERERDRQRERLTCVVFGILTTGSEYVLSS